MVAVAVVAHELIGLDWGPAFVLGAIVSPTDAVAPAEIMRRIGAPRRLLTVVEGENLTNDWTALVLYRFAVTAVVTGSFSLWEPCRSSSPPASAVSSSGSWPAGSSARSARGSTTRRPRSRSRSCPGYAAYLPAEELGRVRRDRGGDHRPLHGLAHAAAHHPAHAPPGRGHLGDPHVPPERGAVPARRAPAAGRHRRLSGRATSDLVCGALARERRGDRRAAPVDVHGALRRPHRRTGARSSASGARRPRSAWSSAGPGCAARCRWRRRSRSRFRRTPATRSRTAT